MQNQELHQDLYKPIIRTFEKRKVHSFFIYNVWGTDLADIELIKDLDFCYVLLIFIANTHWLLIQKKPPNYNCECFSNNSR